VVAIAGLVWIGGRVLYALGYMREAAKRSMGFGIASLGFGALALDATIGLVRSLIA
jgi:glutathione S-transferase